MTQGPKLSICLHCQWQLSRGSISPPKRIKGPSPSRLASQLSPLGLVARRSTCRALLPSQVFSNLHPRTTRRLAHGVAIRHLNLTEESVPLGFNALGKPAQIRILKEKPKRVRKHVAPINEPQGPAPQASPTTDSEGVLDSSQVDTRLGDSRGAIKYIDQVRTTLLEKLRGHDPTLHQCHSVGQQLQQGFTKTQLRAYVKQLPNCPAKNQGDLECSIRSMGYTRTRWICGVTEFPETASKRLAPPSRLRPKEPHFPGLWPPEETASGLAYGKPRLVDKILGEIWKLRPLEERQQKGEVDMKVEAGQLEVLLKNNNETFEKISTTFGVQFSVAQDTSVIRLTAEYQVAGDALAAIEDAITDVRATIVPVGITHTGLPFQKKPEAWNAAGDEAYLRTVEEVTKTVIMFEKPTRKDKQIDAKVFSSSRNPRSLIEACRLLERTRRIPVLRPQGRLPVLKPPALRTVPMDVSTAFPIHDRRTPWYRLMATPLHLRQSKEATEIAVRGGRKAGGKVSQVQGETTGAKSAKTTVELKTAIQKQLRSVMRHIPLPANGLQTSPSVAEIWNSGIRHSFSAHIGALIHPQNQGAWVKNLVRADGRLWNKESSGAKVLLSSPKLSETLESIAQGRQSLSNELYICLRPDKVFSKKGISHTALPPLEICIRLDDTKKTSTLQEVQLKWKSRDYDLMLYEQSADIRFEGRSLLTASAGPASVTEFLKCSNLDVWGCTMLETPEQLEIGVPWLALKMPPAKAPKSDIETSSEPQAGLSAPRPSAPSGRPWECVQARYTFSHMQHRSNLRMAYQGYPLVYTTVESGQTGGRWTELRLEIERAEVAQGVDKILSDKLFQKWYDAAHQLVASLPK